MDVPPDTLLRNRYRIERMLGQGGMGAVYLAQDTALDMQVAVKVNRNPLPQSSALFLREARLLAGLRHTHLPRVTDYFIAGEAQYLVMDYVPGQDLDSLLKAEGAQPHERVLDWARQLGSALSYLHRQNPPIIHRDVKPANVRLSGEGQVVLVDFGIAKVADPAQHTTTTTGAGYTPGYAPPEQYGGTMRTGPYSDQYALAALLYHLLTNQKPADSILRAMGSAALVPLSQLNPRVPARAQAAVERALSLKPEERFPSVDEFLQALDAAPRPAVSPAAAAGQPEAKPAAAEAARASATRAAARPAPALTAQAAPAARPESQPRKWFVIAAAGLGITAVLVLLAAAAGGYFFWRSRQTAPPPTALAAQTARAPLAGTDMVLPTVTASAAPSDSSTAPPHTPTATAEPSLTPVPSVTQVPTATPTPAPTRPPLGGGGVVAFASDRGDGETLQIWTMQVALNDQGQAVISGERQLTDGPGDKHAPAWSPDGQKLVYMAPGTKEPGDSLWVINADGGGAPVELTHMAGDELEPAWSPDGQWIAFANNGRFDKVRALYIIRPDGSEMIKLSYEQEEFAPAWSPKMQLGFVMNIGGSQVFFIRGLADPKTGAAPEKPYYVTPVFFDFTALHGNLGQVSEPAWSPDGQWLVYTRERFNSKQIYTAHYPVRVVEQDIIRLTESSQEGSPNWSPDGQWIVFTSARDGNAEIYLMRSTGQMQTNLTLSPGQDKDPAWQPLTGDQ